MVSLRTLKEDDKFVQASAAIFGSAKNADVAIESAVWTLARHMKLSSFPIVGYASSDGRPIRTIKTTKTPVFPAVTIYFSEEDDETVVLHDVILSRPSKAP